MNTKRYNVSYILLLCPYPDVKAALRRPGKTPVKRKIYISQSFAKSHIDPVIIWSANAMFGSNFGLSQNAMLTYDFVE